MSLSPEQHAQRLGGITATDIAAIVGVHPHRSPLDVFLEKTGQAEPFVENVRSRWGEKLEPMIREDYEERHGVRVEVHGTLEHGAGKPWWMYTADGFVFPRGSRVAERGLEIKVHGRDAVYFGGLEYGAPGTDEVPPHELVQCSWGMGGSGLGIWDLVAFLDGAPIEYVIDRDEDLIEILADAGERFLVDHIRTGVAPAPDGSKAWDGWLRRRWKENTLELISIDDQPEMLALIEQLRSARAAEAAAEALKETTTQKLKNAIGDKAGLSWKDPSKPKPQKVTWKRSADGTREAWKTTAQAMAVDAGLAISSHADVLAELLHDLRNGATTASATEFNAEAVTALELAFGTLRSIATRGPTLVTQPGSRPFNVPRWWKSATPKDDTTTEEI